VSDRAAVSRLVIRDLAAGELDAICDAVTWRQIALAALDQAHALHVENGRLVRRVRELNDALRAARQGEQREAA
jgi:hypothetical protein